MVTLFPLVALEPLRSLHLINGNRNPAVARPVDDGDETPQEDKRDGVIDLTLDPSLLLEIPPDIRFAGNPAK